MLGIVENGVYVGNIGLHDLKRPNRSGMIGYWLAEAHQGKGIMTDCARAMTEYGFAELGLNRIYIHCAAGNAKSRAIPERLGYVQEGVLQDAEHLYGMLHDLIVYGITHNGWEALKDIAYYKSLPAVFDGFIDVPDLYDGVIRLICTEKHPANPEKN